MSQFIAHTAILVNDYDEAIDFYVNKLGFILVQDVATPDTATPDTATPSREKRWVIVSPSGATNHGLLLAKADNPEQKNSVGNQTGGRVFLFLHTDDFWRDYDAYRARGVEFARGEPRNEPYGTVAVFKDLYGNLWDLIQPTAL